MKFFAIAAGMAAIGLSATMSPVSAQTVPAGPAPIAVLGVHYTSAIGDQNGNGIDASQSGLTIVFKDVSTKTVHTVIFDIHDASGHRLATVSRSGTFSPGISITRHFGVIRLKEKHGAPAEATPISVTFADGTLWTRVKRVKK